MPSQPIYTILPPAVPSSSSTPHLALRAFFFRASTSLLDLLARLWVQADQPPNYLFIFHTYNISFSQSSAYRSIIDDVVTHCRSEFDEMGIEQAVLDALQAVESQYHHSWFLFHPRLSSLLFSPTVLGNKACQHSCDRLFNRCATGSHTGLIRSRFAKT